jgi:hypothetical protein
MLVAYQPAHRAAAAGAAAGCTSQRRMHWGCWLGCDHPLQQEKHTSERTSVGVHAENAINLLALVQIAHLPAAGSPASCLQAAARVALLSGVTGYIKLALSEPLLRTSKPHQEILGPIRTCQLYGQLLHACRLLRGRCD